MAGHQLYDMMHSRLRSIATGTMSGTPGSAGPNLQLSPQMMQPTSSPSSKPTTLVPFSMVPYGDLPNFGNPMSMLPHGGLPNFGNATSGTLMPFTAQSNMTSSLPEPQSARAAAAAATTPAAASSTNPTPTDTQPPPHYRGSRSCRRRRRHSHSRTSHHRAHDKSPRRRTTRRARHSSRSTSPSHPRHRSRRSHHTPISPAHAPLGAGPPQRHSPAPRTKDPQRAPDTHASHGSTSWHSCGWDTDKSQKSSSHRRKIAPQGHSTHSWGKRSHNASNTGNWSNQGKLQSWQQQQSWQQPRSSS